MKVTTASSTRMLAIPAKEVGQGSSVNGGEFLMLALATCFCNDLYREAAQMQIAIDAVEVEASADFDGVGIAASNITYRARVSSPAARKEIEALLQRTDRIAEVHNTLRSTNAVVLRPWEE